MFSARALRLGRAPPGETAITDPLDILPGALRGAIASDAPVLVAGPTASGKSALAVAIAERFGGVIVNADALQVYDAWPILTARPDPADLARAPHRLFGHLPHDAAYSAGDWLREVAPLLDNGDRPIIVGGTGLYFTALTAGLADIPAIPAEVRAEGDDRLAARGLAALVRELDAPTAARIDRANPARVLRAWEVLRATGRGLSDWQAETPPPLLPLARTVPILIDPPKAWLDLRAAARFDTMLAAGALDEARAERDRWNPVLQSARAIGAGELIAHIDGRIGLPEARTRAIEATRQYAKRQRTWFAARRAGWHTVAPPDTIAAPRR